MSKICPETGEKVLYLTCNECENKEDCRMGLIEKKTKPAVHFTHRQACGIDR